MGAPVTIPPPGLIFMSAHKRLHQFTLAADFPLSWWRRDGPLCVYTQREGEPSNRFSHPWKTLLGSVRNTGGLRRGHLPPRLTHDTPLKPQRGSHVFSPS